MGLEGAKILVIDDSPAEGQQIVEALWEANYPAMFFRFDQQILEGLREAGKPMKGVRAVFMDMDLLGHGMQGDGKTMYSVIQGALESLLDKNNGPYTLITWTRFDEYSDDLYAFLRDRMEDRGRAPTALMKLKKEDFRPGNPGALATQVQTCLGQHGSLTCLSSWEVAVNAGASDIVSNLAGVAGQGVQADNEFDARLASLLRKLSVAEAGKEIERRGDITPHMHSVLSQLLDDVASQISLPLYDPEHPEGIGQIGREEMNSWRRQINAMLNYEKVPKPKIQPGSVFSYPDTQVAADLLRLPNWRAQDVVIRAYYFRRETASRRNAESTAVREAASKRATLVLVDITPPCDHAQKKVIWRTFVLTAKVPLDCLSYLWRWPDDQEIAEEGRVWADYLWISPEFKLDEDIFVLLFNSRMMFTINNDNTALELLGIPNGRIREVLLADLLGWIGRQISRIGHVAL